MVWVALVECWQWGIIVHSVVKDCWKRGVEKQPEPPAQEAVDPFDAYRKTEERERALARRRLDEALPKFQAGELNKDQQSQLLGDAASVGDKDAVRACLNGGVIPRLADLFGAIDTTKGDALAVVQLILMKSFSLVNAQAKYTGSTPLHYAMEFLYDRPERQAQMVQLLVDYGASVYLLNERGVTPLNLGLGFGGDNPVDAILILSREGAIGSLSLLEAEMNQRWREAPANQEKIAEIKRLWKANPDVD